jgi:hypothetical protein
MCLLCLFVANLFLMLRKTCLVVITLLLSACNRKPPEPAYTPGLGEIMTFQQMRHVKLWLAGQAGNWPLASYELDELNEGFDDVAMYHPTHKDAELPIPQLIDKMIKAPVGQLDEAIKAKDQDRFAKAFDQLTEGCNGCHQATKFGFNVVTRPTGNPYTNQVFEPAH